MTTLVEPVTHGAPMAFVSLAAILTLVTSALLRAGGHRVRRWPGRCQARLYLCALAAPLVLAGANALWGDVLHIRAASRHHVMCAVLPGVWAHRNSRALAFLVVGGDWLALAMLGIGGARSVRFVWQRHWLACVVAPYLTSPSPKLRAVLDTLGPERAASEFYECNLPRHDALILGTLRPRCVLSTQLVEAASEDELADAISHELAHLRGCGSLAGLTAGVAAAAFQPLPGITYICQCFAQATEIACDDAVTCRTRRPERLASLLVSVGLSGFGTTSDGWPQGCDRPIIAYRGLPERVERLIAYADNPGSWLASPTALQRWAGWLAITLLVGVAIPLHTERLVCFLHCLSR